MVEVVEVYWPPQSEGGVLCHQGIDEGFEGSICGLSEERIESVGGARFNVVGDVGFSFGVGDFSVHFCIEVAQIEQVIGDVFSAELGEVGIEENGWFAQFLSQCASPGDGIGEFGVVFVGS